MVLWDPSKLSADKLILPLNYFYLIQYFDGEHSLDQIGGLYLKQFGEFLLPDLLKKLLGDLDEKLFLEGARVQEAQRAAIEAYRQAPVRPAAYAGKSYEAEPAKLRAQVKAFFTSKEGPDSKPSEHRGKMLKGLVAPHYEPKSAGPVYAWAYKELIDGETPDCFVLLGTGNAGLEQHFAVTDKDFETPLGRVPVNHALVQAFRTNGGEEFFQDELSHRYEHSLEFQLPFLQYARGVDKPFTIVPVLCAFPAVTLADPQYRESQAQIERFIQAMTSALAQVGTSVCFIASAELAHIGLRYGDKDPPTDFAFHKCMQTDMAMLKYVEERNPQAFFEFIAKERDQRHIYGFATIYTLLRLMSAAEGQVLRYDRGITDQFNSTATYASIAFFSPPTVLPG